MTVSAINKVHKEAVERPAFDDWYGFLLNQAAGRIRTQTVAALSPLGITPPHLRALEAIAEAQPLSQTRLSEIVHMDRTTIVLVIDHFERLGAAERLPDPADRRSHALMLTKKGHQILRAARARARAVEREFLAPLSPLERETLQMLLCRLFDPLTPSKG